MGKSKYGYEGQDLVDEFHKDLGKAYRGEHDHKIETKKGKKK